MKRQAVKKSVIFIILGVAMAAGIFVLEPVGRASSGEEVIAKTMTISSSLSNTEVVQPQYVRSSVLYAEFPFIGIGMSWDGELPESYKVSIRARAKDGGWGEWMDVSPQIDFPDGWTAADGKNYAQPIFFPESDAWQYSLWTLEDEHLPRIEDITFRYFDSREERTTKANIGDWLRSLISGASAVTPIGVDVVSRAEWGANESLGQTSSGGPIWEPEYAQPAKIIIHHTAGSDGGNDPKSIVRGIYYWHTVSLGWGDIGYNYLIDKNGVIYEGREGGDGVVGGHAYNEAKDIGYNRGSIGIAVLGQYESGVPTAAAIDALTRLSASLGVRFGLEPDGNGFFVDETLPNVFGHKEVDNTLCPGENLGSNVDTIRSEAQKLFEAAGGYAQSTNTLKASFVRQSVQPVKIPSGSQKQLWVEFKNTGTVTWRSYAQPAFKIVSANVSSNLMAGGAASGNTAVLDTPNVAPGEVGRFFYTLKAPNDTVEANDTFVLKAGSATVAIASFNVTVQVTGLSYAAAARDIEILPATFSRARNTTVVRFTNLGTQAWKRGEVKLGIYDLGNRGSRYQDASWPDDNGMFDFEELEVVSGGTATFRFVLLSPDEPGLYLNVYRVSGPDGLAQKEDRSVTRVDSPYEAKFISHTVPAAMLNIWRPAVTLTFKNTGVMPWDRSVGLQVVDLGDTDSQFANSNWDDIRIATHLNEAQVNPGEFGTFTLRLYPPQNSGLYLNIMRVFKDGRPIKGGTFNAITRVD
ncbi:MAG: N-acetylmuramoyl-L-alanine amidase family 2 [Parcubacteria group bacterium GW2011_GWC2_49_9]|nr:MAG: N-acetylmuramoyl-L-alanine amidase family 2 [Parcubacteria group bacterium GW2011_GWC2_49_9]